MSKLQKERISGKTIERLICYRRILEAIDSSSGEGIHSHELGRQAGVTAAQVRRDLMIVSCEGSPNKGYNIKLLRKKISEFLGEAASKRVALVGVGNLGRALLSYFSQGRSSLVVAVAFDSDADKAGRFFNGCKCYHTREIADVLAREQINAVILAVPNQAAQTVVDVLVAADVRGILNMSSAALKVPASVYVEHVDVTRYLEKIIFFGTRAQL